MFIKSFVSGQIISDNNQFPLLETELNLVFCTLNTDVMKAKNDCTCARDSKKCLKLNA